MFASLNLSQFPRIFEVLVILLLLLQDQKSKRPTDISGLLEFIQGVSKKNALSWFLAITPLWKGLEIKVGGVLKTSGNSQCDRHRNFPN